MVVSIKIFQIFTPKNWGNDPILTSIYFSDGLVKNHQPGCAQHLFPEASPVTNLVNPFGDVNCGTLDEGNGELDFFRSVANLLNVCGDYIYVNVVPAKIEFIYTF